MSRSNLEGFSRFIVPPLFDDLQPPTGRQKWAGNHLNASEYTCDALIVLYTRPPVRVDLDCSLEDVARLLLSVF